MTERMRIDELCGRAAESLGAAHASGSGRVRDLPDIRTIRYYTTLGLLDRPAELRGRTAYYGVRHLLQLVAIKRLQAAGRTLVEIQQELSGLSTSRLRRLAGPLPESWGRTPSAPPSVTEPSAAARRFWEMAPQASMPVEQAAVGQDAIEQDAIERGPVERGPVEQGPVDEPVLAAQPAMLAEPGPATRTALVVELAPGVTLTWEGLAPEALDAFQRSRLDEVLRACAACVREVWDEFGRPRGGQQGEQ